MRSLTNLSDDSCEDENTKHEVDDNECVLGVSNGQRQVRYGRHSQRRPEECVQIHATERCVDRVQNWVDAVIDEHVRSEADPRTQQDKEAGVPMNDDKDVNDQVDDADCVGEAALRLDPIKELHDHNGEL